MHPNILPFVQALAIGTAVAPKTKKCLVLHLFSQLLARISSYQELGIVVALPLQVDICWENLQSSAAGLLLMASAVVDASRDIVNLAASLEVSRLSVRGVRLCFLQQLARPKVTSCVILLSLVA